MPRGSRAVGLRRPHGVRGNLPPEIVAHVGFAPPRPRTPAQEQA